MVIYGNFAIGNAFLFTIRSLVDFFWMQAATIAFNIISSSKTLETKTKMRFENKKKELFVLIRTIIIIIIVEEHFHFVIGVRCSKSEQKKSILSKLVTIVMCLQLVILLFAARKILRSHGHEGKSWCVSYLATLCLFLECTLSAKNDNNNNHKQHTQMHSLRI